MLVHQKKGWRARRSVLFMPASNRKILLKINELNCDCVILDLEDSVADEQRADARENLIELIKGKTFENKEVVIRVSAPAANDYSQDVITAIECGVDAILVPKIENAKELNDLNALLNYSGVGSTKIWAMIETARAMRNLREITSSSTNLTCLVVGPNDLARETGVLLERGRQYLVPWLMEIILHGRANSLTLLDGVLNKFDDEDWLHEECEQGMAMGFDGKTLIHPKQIAIANAAFSPSASQIEYATRVVLLFEKEEHHGKNALQLDGEMVEKLHLENARALLALADQFSG